jgi:hypothetical protein
VHLDAVLLERAAHRRYTVDHHGHARPHAQHVAAHGQVVVVGDRDPVEAARPQVLQEADGRERLVDDREVLAHGGEERLEVQHEARTLVVRHVVCLDRDPLGLDQPRDGLDARAVRAVPEAHRHRALVEPEAVAAVGVGGFLQRPDHRHAQPLELRGGVRRLGLPRRLGHAQRDAAAAGDEQRVVHVDRVDLALEGVGDLDLRAETGEQLDERVVLAGERVGVGRAPGGAVPVAGERRAADEHPLQRGDHRGDAEGPGHGLHAIDWPDPRACRACSIAPPGSPPSPRA